MLQGRSDEPKSEGTCVLFVIVCEYRKGKKSKRREQREMIEREK